MKLYTQKEVVRRLKIPYYRLEYLHKTKRISEPERTTSGIRIYSDYDIDEIVEVLSKQHKHTNGGCDE